MTRPKPEVTDAPSVGTASPTPASSRRSLGVVVLVSSAILVAYLAVLRSEGAATEPWLAEAYDRDAYHRIAQWYPSGRVPYRDIPSEYPTLATLAFAVPYWGPGGSALTKEGYRERWSMLMAAVLLGTVGGVAAWRRRLGLRPEVSLLLLLPSPLYFALMRYDILCAALVCVSLAAFGVRRFALAHVVLGLATFVKWYPAVLLPVYLAFLASHDGLSWRRPADWLRGTLVRGASAYLVTVALIAGLSIAWFTWDGFLVPVRFQVGRGGQYFNPYWLLEQHGAALGLDRGGGRLVNGAFLALQLGIVPVLLFARIRTTLDVFRYGLLAIVLFITFAHVDSPQWILWYLPPALLFVSRAVTLSAVAALGVWNYALFPVAYQLYQDDLGGPTFSAIVLVKDLIVVALVVLTFRERVHERGGLGEAAAAGPRTR